MSRYVLHWPAAGIEDGEYVGFGDEEIDANPFARRVVYAAGLIATLVSPLLVGALGFVLVAAVGGPAGLGLEESSVTSAIFIGALVVVGVDAMLEHVALSPIRNVAGIVGVVLVLPPAIVYARFRHSSGDVDDPERLASVAGSSDVSARLIASQVFRRKRQSPPVTDGGTSRDASE